MEHSVAPKLRSDLQWVQYQEDRRWVACDPISSSYFYFSQLEYELGRMLDGKTSLERLYQAIQRKWLGTTVSQQWVETFVQRLARANLLQPSLRGPVTSAGRSTTAGPLRRALLNPFAIRFPFFQIREHGAVARLLASFLFHPISMGIAFLLAFTTLLVVGLQTIENSERIFYDLERIRGDRWILLLLLYAVIKSLHELGHYLACVKYGVQCREVGVMFLMFTPCLYCDTTDSWRLTSRWQRALIAAAGILVELWIAGVAGLIFLNTQSELVRTLSAGAMLMCTVGTLLINGNPLFRYDGYYILSDLWGVPNLTYQSQRAKWGTFVEALGGRSVNPEEFDKPVWQLCWFGVLASVYRTLVLFLIAFTIWRLFIPAGGGVLALFLMALLMLGLVVMAIRFSRSIVAEFFASKPIRAGRVTILIGLLGGLIYAFFWLPLPNTVRSRGYLELAEKKSVYWPETGSLMSVGELTGELEAGSLLFSIDNPELRLDLLHLNQEIDELGERIRVLESLQVDDSSASFELPTLKELRNELLSKRSHLLPQLESFTQRALHTGYFTPAPMGLPVALTAGVREEEVGHALHLKNIGMVLERGKLAGWFSSNNRCYVHAIVSEQDVRWVRPKTPVRVILDSSPNRYSEGIVQQITPEPLTEFPFELLGDPSLIGVRKGDGRLAMETPHYLVVVDGPALQEESIRGSRVTVEFEGPSRPLWDWVREFLAIQFRPTKQT